MQAPSQQIWRGVRAAMAQTRGSNTMPKRQALNGHQQEQLDLVENVNDIMHSGNWGQMVAIRHQVLADEARQKKQVGGTQGCKSRREPRGDLSKTRLVPAGLGAVQRGCNDDLNKRLKAIS